MIRVVILLQWERRPETQLPSARLGFLLQT